MLVVEWLEGAFSYRAVNWRNSLYTIVIGKKYGEFI